MEDGEKSKAQGFADELNGVSAGLGGGKESADWLSWFNQDYGRGAKMDWGGAAKI